MARVVKVLTWTAILTLPGGVFLLPVVVAKHYADQRAKAQIEPPKPPEQD